MELTACYIWVSRSKQPDIGLLLPITVANLVYMCHHSKFQRLVGFRTEIIFPAVLEAEVQVQKHHRDQFLLSMLSPSPSLPLLSLSHL